MNRLLRCALVGGAAYATYRAAVACSRRYDFRNRVVVITGGSRGLGLILARQFLAEGARVAFCARDEEELAGALRELAAYEGDIAAYTCDLTKMGDLRDFFATVKRELGPVDVLVNNAGTIQVGPAETMTADDFRTAMALHFWAPLRCIEQVLPEMRRRRDGRIVNISSIGGKIAVPHLLPYSASKFALVGLSQGLRAELAGQGIYVTTVCPGLMRTGSPMRAFFKGKHREEFTWFSISGALPLLSMNADRAGRQIIEACRRGKADATLSLAAKLGVRLNHLAPELMSDLLRQVARLLPDPGGIGTASAEGIDSTSEWSPSWITSLSDEAAVRNNELTGSNGRGRGT